eukprot:TRINITY_DN10176_c0_g1_i3.p1 TRINITY_DN10176_c0_g1~~TRINITY_DN10176_c0_g1_i3.p1  ORF type:complete len:268 (+),score=88.61 TRINITY_DN10176_c0_g1_i3:36-806(+)
MCIRDRYQRRVHGEQKIINCTTKDRSLLKEQMRVFLFVFATLAVFNVALAAGPNDELKNQLKQLLAAANPTRFQNKLTDAQLNDITYHLNLAMKYGDINSCVRKAAFLTQAMYGSKGFQVFAISDSHPLNFDEKKKPLAGILGDDRIKYKRRSPFPLIGRQDYKECGKALGVDLEKNPQLAEKIEWTFKVAAYIWKNKHFNKWADEDENTNPIGITFFNAEPLEDAGQLNFDKVSRDYIKQNIQTWREAKKIFGNC